MRISSIGSRSRSLAGALSLVCLLGLPTSARAQFSSGGEILGRATTTAGESIQRPVVILFDRNGIRQQRVEGGLDGRFRFRGLAPGTYALRGEVLGYVPGVVTGVQVRPGRPTRADIVLSPGAAGARVDSAAWAGVPPDAGSGVFDRTALAGLPTATPAVSSLLERTGRVGADLGIDGLPGQATWILVDGIPYRAARAPGQRGFGGNAALLSTRGLTLTEYAGAPSSPEVAIGTGALISAYSRRGTGGGVEVEALGSTGPLRMSSADPDDAPDDPSIWLGGSVDVADADGGSAFVLGADAWSVRRPRAAVLGGAIAGAPDGWGDPYTSRRDGLSAFARFDKTMPTGGQLWGTARFAVSPAADDPVAAAWALDDPGRRADLIAGAGYLFDVGGREVIEVKGGVSRSSWRAASVAGAELGVPEDAGSTVISGQQRRIGSGLFGNAEVSRLDATGSVSLRLARGAHQFQLGVQGGVAVHDQQWGFGSPPNAIVGSGNPFAAWEGHLSVPIETPRDASFSIPRFAAFAADDWSLTDELRLSFGARVQTEWLPVDDIGLLSSWNDATGYAGGLDPTMGQISSLGGTAFLDWTPAGESDARLVLGGGVYHDEFDPMILGEGHAYRVVDLRRMAGSVDGLPSVPDATPTSSPQVRPSLTILRGNGEGGLEPPTTYRGRAGFSRRLSPRLSLGLSARYRRTESLSRRRNLNVPTVALGTDPAGRAIRGNLVQLGSWIGPDPSTRGRFTQFDDVWEIDQSGWSEYMGVTGTLTLRAPGGLVASAAYTWSRTRDNLPGLGSTGRHFGYLLAGGTAADTNVSDLDRPHALFGSIDIPLPIPTGGSLSGVVSYRSGTPFTPGYPLGVDVDGDGLPGNEPAFVDPSVVGDALADWSCLSGDRDGFATRNGCRGDALLTIDARLTLGTIDLGSSRLHLVVDVLNALDTTEGIIDTALLEVDPAGEIVRAGDRVTLPLRPNPDFGSTLVDWSSGRMFRIGLRIGG